MFWIILSILGYFFSALSGMIDKILLSGPLPKPKVYAFYIGILGTVVGLILIPFGFQIPELSIVGLALLSGGIWIPAAVGLFEALKKYEASRIIPAIGGLAPCFVFLFNYSLVWLTTGRMRILEPSKIIAFLLLIFGSVFINYERKKRITKESLKFSLVTAVLFATSFVSTKYVFLAQPFVSGFIWMRFGGFLGALPLLFSKEVKEELFKRSRKKTTEKPLFKNPKIATVFLVNQGIGGTSGILQNLAIYFVPLIYLPFVNALEGTKYIFLFLFATILSTKFPKILSEKITKTILLQKILAIILISIGLAFLF
jgi:hypothetical protein